MIKIFFLAACAVIVLSIIMMILPSETYSKYAKFICAVISVAVMLNIVFGADIDFTLSGKYLEETFSPAQAQEVAVNQSLRIIEGNVEENLKKKYKKEFECEVKIKENISYITIYSPEEIDEEKLKKYVTEMCGIKKENIIVEYR